MKLVQGVANTSIQKKGAASEESSEMVGGEPAAGPIPTIGLTMGMTKNIGNYESIRVNVSLNMPVFDGDLDTTYAFVKDWVDQRMLSLLDEVDADLAAINCK